MRVKIIFICKKYGSARKNASKNIFTYNECSTKEVKFFLLTMRLARLPIEWTLTDDRRKNERTAQHIT